MPPLSGPKLSELVSYLSVSVRSSGVDTTGDGVLIYLKWQSSRWRSCWTCNLPLTFALFYCSNRIAVRLDRYASVQFIPRGQRPASRRDASLDETNLHAVAGNLMGGIWPVDGDGHSSSLQARISCANMRFPSSTSVHLSGEVATTAVRYCT